MRSEDLVGIGLFLLLIGVGFLLALCPHLLIQTVAKLQRRAYNMLGHSDEMLDRMPQLPWGRAMRDGLPLSQFVREAEQNPRRFAVPMLLIRVTGAGIVLASGTVLLIAILFISTGVIE